MEKMNREKNAKKSNDTLDYLRESAERESKLRQDELEIKRKQEEANIGYSAGTAFSAARSTTVTNAATATAATTVYADDA